MVGRAIKEMMRRFWGNRDLEDAAVGAGVEMQRFFEAGGKKAMVRTFVPGEEGRMMIVGQEDYSNLPDYLGQLTAGIGQRRGMVRVVYMDEDGQVRGNPREWKS